MASIKEKTTKSGERFYEIRVRMGREGATLSTRFYPKDTWSNRTTEKELAKFAADFERKCKAGEVQTIKQKKAEQEARRAQLEANPTVSVFFETRFLPKKKEKQRAVGTLIAYQDRVNAHIAPTIGNKKITSVTTSELQNLLDSVDGSYNTKLNIYSILSGIFSQAFKENVITENPMLRVERPEKSKMDKAHEAEQMESRAYSATELAYILQCLEAEPLMWKAYAHLIARTGLRRSEGLAIRWENVDTDNNTIDIRSSLTMTKHDGIVSGTTKSGLSRTIYIPQYVADMLKELRQNANGTYKLSGYVFTARDGVSPMSPAVASMHFKEFAEKHDLEGFHLHKLRHSFASIALQNGSDILSVSRLLGHANPTVTMKIYSHSSEESRIKTSNIFNSALDAAIAKANKENEKQA